MESQWQSHFEESWQYLGKLNVCMQHYDLAPLFLASYPSQMKRKHMYAERHDNNVHRIFLLNNQPLQNQVPLERRMGNKLWCVHAMEWCTAKENKSLPHTRECIS